MSGRVTKPRMSKNRMSIRSIAACHGAKIKRDLNVVHINIVRNYN